MSTGNISERAQRALKPALSYGKAFMEAQARPWSPSDPEGNIICSVAENKLTADMLHERLSAVASQAPISTLSYPKAFKGAIEVRKAVARMLERTFMAGADVDPEHLLLIAGAGAVLDNLFWSLCDKGDGVMLPKPIYPAFVNDMEVRSGCTPILFALDEPGGEPWSIPAPARPTPSTLTVAQQLDAAYAQAEAQGVRVRMLLLAQPNNPMGIVYSRETIQQAVRWCLEKEVHLVSDEIYANSVWGEGAAPFVSTEVLARQLAADLPTALAERIPTFIHVIFGFSKDWCASGLRVGGLHTRNVTLANVLDNLSYFHTCSSPTLWALTEALSDDTFVDAFVKENQARMRASYKGLSDALDAAGIPHVRACAAMFAWVDLRAGLREDSWAGEQELWEELCAAGVLFTPGKACMADAPGFFRICWAWVAPEALPIAVKRIAALLEARRAAA